MYNLLRRALKSASREDLEQVVLHCVAFTEGLRLQGFITEALAQEAHEYLQPHTVSAAIASADDTSATDRSEVSGPGVVDRTDEEWQEHTGQASDSGLSTDDESGDAQGLESAEDSGGGHQTEVEGDTDPDRQESTQALPEDGAG